MAGVYETLASLRIFGDDLDPDEISALLGASPTSCAIKGQDRVGRDGIKRGVVRTGRWLLEAIPRQPEDLDSQIVELLSALTSDAAVWRRLAARFKADIFCGLFMKESNEGLGLRPETLEMVGSRGLSLGFDIYGPSPGGTAESGDETGGLAE